MADSGTISCCPWRQTAPRPLTDFEWRVVASAMAGAMNEVKTGLATTDEPVALQQAVMVQPVAAWTTNQFSPAPCVCTLWYEALARWYASFDAPARANLLNQIRGGLLGSGQQPWVAAGQSRIPSYTNKPSSAWEGQLQTISPQYMPQTAESFCATIRWRTAYAPVTGRDLLVLMKFLSASGQLPQGLEAMASILPQVFLDRTFLLGIQGKANMGQEQILAALATPNMVQMALQLVDDVALLWAPGQGVSLLAGLAQGGMDPAKLLAMLTSMTPDLFGQVMNNLPSILGQLPNVANQLPALQAQMPGLFTGAQQVLGTVLGGGAIPGMNGFGAIAAPTGQPGTPPTTGLQVIDQPGTTLAAQQAPPADLLAKLGTSATARLAVALGVAIITGAIVYESLRRRGRV